MSLTMPSVVQLSYNPALGGILASTCFALASSIYLLCLRRLRNASLRSVIPSSGTDVAVVCPGGSTHGRLRGKACMTSEEAMALAEVLQCIGTLNKRPGVYSCAETVRQSGVISLGGFQNSFTKTLVEKFCPGLHIGIPEGRGGDWQICFGAESIKPTQESSIAFVIYLTGRRTGCENPALLVFGQYGIDTVAAARYVRMRSKQLYYDFHGRDFAVRLDTHPALGYQGFPKVHTNISAEVFTEQAQQRRGWRVAARWHVVERALSA
jgi:hypothetical protein